ncbi:MAG: ATP synthase F1 subunit gamma [Paramuribaculum sp.]|nr:ATP synthase F1 subunit gamma [Bacteroides sp.]MBD5375383.1 ATP synthase F1 subunit gamma [Bacteroides sp.]MBD5375786.1 ATP synthase F1 subunit gamma [Bacteroides sp.]MDE7461475.1 ATP synthase F1 subunit gamma [Paramuribaculum sp.]
MATLRELKTRIGSVASSEKITGAMKMISSAKMHKAEQALRRLAPFRSQVETVIGNLLSADAEFSSPLLEQREVRTVAIVVFGSDDGLCGAYNVNIFKQLLSRLNSLRNQFGESVRFVIFPIGKKMLKAVRAVADSSISVRTMEGVDSKTSGEGVRLFVDTLRQNFEAGEFDRVDCLYMNFKSVSRQIPRAEQLLPVVHDTFTSNGVSENCRPYIFEPSPQAIFSSVLPMFLLAVMHDIFTENRASEQAARVMAMQSANDNAKKLLDSLSLEYNKLRQQSITTELLDILGGQVR